MADPVTGVTFTPDGVGGGLCKGQLNYADGASELFEVYRTADQVQAEMGRILKAENVADWAQSMDSPPAATPQPDVRDVARKVGWDCWVDALPRHPAPPPPPPPPPPPAQPIAAPNVSA